MQAERRLFPGFVAIALAAIALFPESPRKHEKHENTKRRHDGYQTRFAYALGLVLAFEVSLGFNGQVYPALYDYFLPFRALRIPARMGLFVGFSVAVLAGYGLARVASRIESHRV